MLPTLHIEIERWKFNKQFALYVSSFGRIKDKNKKLIKPLINNTGYFVIMKDNVQLRVHSLVARTFLGEYEGLTVDHLDSNKRNNKLSNLQLVPEEENLKRAEENLLRNSAEFKKSIEAMPLKTKGVTENMKGHVYKFCAYKIDYKKRTKSYCVFRKEKSVLAYIQNYLWSNKIIKEKNLGPVDCERYLMELEKAAKSGTEFIGWNWELNKQF